LSPLIPKPTTGRGGLVELVVIVALAIGLALLIQAFLVKPYQIPSGSMEPTLDVGQRVIVGVPHAGETKPRACPAPTPQESQTNFTKRLIVGPGDRLYIKNGHPVVNGVMAKEPFINRLWGPVPRDWIIGEAFFTYWPPGRLGFL